jgi:hypothetical protein
MTAVKHIEANHRGALARAAPGRRGGRGRRVKQDTTSWSSTSPQDPPTGAEQREIDALRARVAELEESHAQARDESARMRKLLEHAPLVGAIRRAEWTGRGGSAYAGQGVADAREWGRASSGRRDGCG